MKQLTALGTDPTHLARYVAIRDRKHLETRDTLIHAHAFVKERYETFTTAFGNDALEQVVGDARAFPIKDALRACYDGSTINLRELKKAIKDAQPKRQLKYCPMCGTTLPNTFDHFMPAVKFPEFAVHSLNLVPCCSKCNSTKGDDWISSKGKRQFLHAYLDNPPDLQFVKVTLHEKAAFTSVGATFTLENPGGISTAFWELIESHFNRLHLIDRYDEQGNAEIAEILSDCRTFLDSGGQDARIFLSNLAADRRNHHGRNHWLTALMEAMAKHQNLESWVSAA